MDQEIIPRYSFYDWRELITAQKLLSAICLKGGLLFWIEVASGEELTSKALTAYKRCSTAAYH